MSGQIKIVFHKKTGFPDPVLGGLQIYRDDQPVCLNVVSKEAVIYQPSILIVSQPVDGIICDKSIPSVLGEELGCKHEINVVRFLPGVGARGTHNVKIKTKVESSVDIPAEDCVKILFLFCTLGIGKFSICFVDLVIFHAVVLIHIPVEAVNAIVETTFDHGCKR